jgi:hypothetical protein
MQRVRFGPVADAADLGGGDSLQMQRVGFGPAADAADLWAIDANAVGWVWLRD